MARAWHSVFCCLAPVFQLAEMPDSATLVFGQEIVTGLVDSEGDWILAWAWNFNFLLIFSVQFAAETKAGLIKGRLQGVSARSWVLIANSLHQRSSDNHLVSSFSKTKSFFNIFRKIIFEAVGIGRWGA
jgi:hypothetical protein